MYPVETINTEFKGKKIQDFDISEDTLVILLENNDVYWSGMKLEYQPTKLKLDPNSILYVNFSWKNQESQLLFQIPMCAY